MQVRAGRDSGTPLVLPLPTGCRPHLLHHPRQRLQGSTALRRKPGQAAMGLRPGLVHLAPELLELPEELFLPLPHVPVLLLALLEMSRDLALGGCDQVLGTGKT